MDLRIADEDRYIDAATLLVQINAMPYSEHDWHWRLRSAHTFGHAAAPETVRGTLALLDAEGIEGELVAARGALGARGGGPDVGPPRVGAPGVQPPPRAVRAARLAPWRGWRCSAPTCCSARSSRERCGRRDMSRWRPATTPSCSWWTSPTTPTPASRHPPSAGLPRLGFYSHVEQDVRQRAEAAGFDRVVPRSRMAREAARARGVDARRASAERPLHVGRARAGSRSGRRSAPSPRARRGRARSGGVERGRHGRELRARRAARRPPDARTSSSMVAARSRSAARVPCLELGEHRVHEVARARPASRA